MIRWFLTRIASLLPVFAVISVVVFMLIHITPGDPAAAILGMEASPADIDALNEKMGFNRPLVEQYFIWTANVLRFDLGYSFFMKQPVTQALAEHLPPTLTLALAAQFLALLAALPAGIIAARMRGSVIDLALCGASLAGVAAPSFLVGLFLMLIFAVNLRVLPVAGYAPPEEGIIRHIRYLIMPALSLAGVQAALIMRMTRASMLEALHMGYVQTARAKGLSEFAVLTRHVLQNAMLPVLTVSALSFGTLITGAVVIESLFNIPGMGQLILNAIKRRDFAVIQGVVLFAAAAYALINLVVDLLYGIIDPRIRRDDS